jgi:hypothetical protein
MLAKNPTTLVWPWPCDDLGEYADRPFRYDVTFQGQVIQGGEGVLLNSVQSAGLNVHIKKNNSFYGNMAWGTPEKQALRAEFAETMAGARLSLCHRSNPRGVMRYRFYEAMSMARVPVLFGDDCLLPFADRIDYDKCSIRLPEAEAGSAGRILKSWLASTSDAEIIEMGCYGREAWQHWLKRENWGVIVDQVVRERLGL